LRRRVERSAYNRAAPRVDARGALPATPAISPQGAMRLDTGLPVTAVAAHLRSQGHAAFASRSCGRYLCNFLYYRSLEWARAHGGNALFVHVPLTHAQGGAYSQDALLRAAQETLRLVLGLAAQQARPAHAPGPAPHTQGARR
jgi:pyroglutamyl-peptidase